MPGRGRAGVPSRHNGALFIPFPAVVSTPAGLCEEPHDVSVLGELKERRWEGRGGGRRAGVTP